MFTAYGLAQYNEKPITFTFRNKYNKTFSQDITK